MEGVYNKAWLHLVTGLLVMSVIIQGVLSIKCLRCFVDKDLGCLEGGLEAQQCPQEDSYCIQYVAILDSNKMTGFRDCSRELMRNGCTDRKMHGEDVKICHLICDKDACNDGPLLGGQSQLIYSVVCILTSVLLSLTLILT